MNQTATKFANCAVSLAEIIEELSNQIDSEVDSKTAHEMNTMLAKAGVSLEELVILFGDAVALFLIAIQEEKDRNLQGSLD